MTKKFPIERCANCLYNYGVCLFWQECDKELRTVPNGHCENWEEDYQVTIDEIRKILREKKEE